MPSSTMLRLLHELHSHAVGRPEAPAVRRAGTDQSEITWGAIHRQVSAIAAALDRRMPPGGAVLLGYPNRPEYVGAFMGALAAERWLFPVSSDSAPPEIVAAARRASVAGAIIHERLAPLMAELFEHTMRFPELDESAVLLTGPRWNAARFEGPGLLLQSSGTTDEPKLIRRDGRSLDAVAANMVRACGFGPEDRVLAAVPLCHSYGLEHGILAPIFAGSCVHVCEKFDLPIVLGELRVGGITMLPGVPFMFDLLCRSGAAHFPQLRRAYSAGGPLPRATFDAFEQQFGLRLGQLYGATEIGSVTFNNPESPGFDPASVGEPMEGVSIRILDADDPHIDVPLDAGDEGQVAVAAPSMLSGYADQADLTLIGGHFLTGDLGMLDSHGALTITGRLNLLIDVGGRKVNPAEVEAVLRRHPDVGACVIIPMRLSATVCRLKAIVSPGRPDVELSAQELRRFARERLSAYKVPRVFEVRPTLPITASGKVPRRLVDAS